MSSLQRRVGMLILIALLLNPIVLFAQSGDITVVGSGIPAPLIQPLASAANVTANVNVTGSDQGFVTFCQGKADVTLSTRAITAGEENDCKSANVSFLEFLLGYNIMAVVANPGSNFGTCLTTDQLNKLFAPSATATNWNQVGTGNANIPLTFDVPPDNTTANALLDDLVDGAGFRSDINTLDSDAKVIDAVSSTQGAIGVVNLPVAQAAGSKVTILQLNTTSAGCAAPSADTASGRTYTAVYPLYAYANDAQAAKVKPLFAEAFSADAAAIVAAQGIVAPTAANLTTDQQVLDNNKTGRQFTKDVTAFTIPQNLVGTVNIAGAATGSDYLTASTANFVKTYAGVTLNQKFTGEPDGMRQLCNGTIDMVVAFSDVTADQAKNCSANNIPTATIKLGSQAVVLVGRGDNFLTCLTTAEVTTIWSDASEKKVTTWDQVDPKFPKTSITLVMPTLGNPIADLLMWTASGQPITTREDAAETKDDPAYRAEAVSNVDGGLTFMNWTEYAALTPDVQKRPTLIQIDGGKGCVTPSEQTITDGTYALARPLLLILNRASLARQEVQSILWYIASDENYPVLAQNGYVGIGFDALPDLRDELQADYALGTQDAAEAIIRGVSTAEATGEATSEATSEATPAPAAATSQATAAPATTAQPSPEPAATAAS